MSAGTSGDARKAIAGAAKRVEAVYSTPFLAHATMEPMNCTAQVHARTAPRCGCHRRTRKRHWRRLSEASGLPLDKCEVYNHGLGGGFGRRGGAQDYVRQAVAIAKQMPGVPIKMIWSREEDMGHDFYRPISQARLAAGLDASGNLTALHVRVSRPVDQLLQSTRRCDHEGKDDRQLQGYWAAAGDAQLGYTVPNLQVEFAMRNTHVPVGPWRGVNTNQNAVYMECFIEEVARAAGKDSLEFRRALMSSTPSISPYSTLRPRRSTGASRCPPACTAASPSSWATAATRRRWPRSRSTIEGKVKVHRMVLALNCGHAVNPDQIAAQVEGSVAYGLSATLIRRDAR